MDYDVVDKLQEEGLTEKTEALIEEHADELLDHLDEFDDDETIQSILDNL